MRVGIEKRYIDSYKNIAKEVNNALKGKRKLLKKGAYEKTLLSRNISIENKKKKLAKAIHEIILHVFSINVNKSKERNGALKNIKRHIGTAREIIQKIKAINNYLEESFLEEAGMIKNPAALKFPRAKGDKKFLGPKGRLSRDYADKIEHTVYRLMQEIEVFDKKLFKSYAKKDFEVIEKEKIGINDLENLLKAESWLLDILEAKMPPPSKVKAKLFNKRVFNQWVPMVLALLSGFEAEYKKESEIFSELKNDSTLRKKIESKIKHVISEKEKIFRLKEERALSMNSLDPIANDYRKVFHEYINAASL